MRMKSIFAAIIASLWLAILSIAPALADSPISSGSITSNQSVVINNVKGDNCTFGYQISGTWTGLIVIEGSVDGATWTATSAVPFNSAAVGGFTANSIGQGSLGGLAAIRLRGNTVSSGSATIIMRASPHCATTMFDNTTGVQTTQSGKWYVTPGNPSAAITLPATTTAYGANTLIANSATAGSVSYPSLTLPTNGGAIPRVRIAINDTTSTAWAGQTIQIDLWAAAPTWTNGDRGAFLPATGTANHIASYSCTVSATYGDGVWGECTPTYGNFALQGTTPVYWSAKAVTGTPGVTGASKTLTVTLEQM